MLRPTGAGDVYVAWAEFGSAQGSVIEFARSTDHGQTFSPAVAPDPADEHQQFADIAVGRDGTVYVALRSRDRLVLLGHPVAPGLRGRPGRLP